MRARSRPTGLRVVSDSARLAEEAAREFALAAREAIRERGSFSVALSGGATPRLAYRRIAALCATTRGASLPGIRWDRVQVFFGDERDIPSISPGSHFRMAWEDLLSRVPIPRSNIHRVRTELGDAVTAADDYERRVFERLGTTPRLDFAILGLGDDGSTASLFPGSTPPPSDRVVFAPWIERLGAYRISMTPTLLNGSRQILFLVSGRTKARALAETVGRRGGRARPEGAPASGIHSPCGETIWLADLEAAGLLERRAG